MVGAVRSRPKSIVLCYFLEDREARNAFDFDCLSRFGRVFRFPKMREYAQGKRSDCSWTFVWGLLCELLKERDSHCFAILAGYSYVPTGAERVYWDGLELSGKLKKKGYRPYADKRSDLLRRMALSQSTGRENAEREKLKKFFNIQDMPESSGGE